MSDTEQSSILMQAAFGVKNGKKIEQCYIAKGELFVEIPPKERLILQLGFPPHNYCLLRDPNVTLHDTGVNVAPLFGVQADYLEGVQDPAARSLEYRKEARLKWIMGLRYGDMVYFKLERDKSSIVPLHSQGRIRYYGAINGRHGVMFGIEITDPEHKGKGNTNGLPHFRCNHNDGVYVPMYEIIKAVDGPSSNEAKNLKPSSDSTDQKRRSPDSSSARKDEPEPTKQQPSSTPSRNIRGKKSIVQETVKGWYHEVVSNVRPPVLCKFSVGDRVVVQSVTGRIIPGTVRWVGPMKIGGKVKIPAVAIGIETDIPVDWERDFPDIHLDMTGSHGQQLFNIQRSKNHGRLYLPEALVLHPDEYAQKKQEENTFEAREAKKWNLTVDQFREQKDIMKKQEDEKARELKGRVNKHEQNHPEEHGVAGVGNMDADNDQHDPLPELKPDQSISQAFTKERVELEQKELERMNKEKKAMQRQTSQENEKFEQTPNRPLSTRKEQDHSSLPSNHSQDFTRNSNRGSPGHFHQDDMSIRSSHQVNQRSNYQNQPSVGHPGSHHQNDSFRQPDAYPTLPAVPSDPAHFTIGTLVTIKLHEGHPVYGTIQWMGPLPGFEGYYAGVELDKPFARCTDGSFNGVHYFTCPPGTGLFCLVGALELDQRFIEPNQIPAAKRQDMTNPFDKNPQYDDSDTPGGPELFSRYIGDEHGIQGHHNSCYLDATVFGLFALSDSFDMMLLEEPHIDIGKKIKHILWKGIVNPLRRYGLARFESIMELRNELENLGRMKGANKDEKDPEEFLNLLFKEILHVEPFISIKRPFGIEKEFFVQLFIEIEPNQAAPPTTENLIRKMFYEQNISFTAVPSKLLLQMPRFGKDFKMFNKIIPSLEMDILPVIDPASRGVQECKMCLDMTATVCCSDCTKEFRTEDTCVFLCKDCSDRIHKNRKEHKFEEVQTKRLMGDVSSISKMQLLSVICIETSHYVCFTRTKDKWLFHDSMANRVYDMYNIPRVTEVSGELNHWVYNPDNHQKLLQTPSREIPECVRRFTQDIYMCVYVNPDLDRYQPVYSSSYDSTSLDPPNMYQAQIESMSEGNVVPSKLASVELKYETFEKIQQDKEQLAIEELVSESISVLAEKLCVINRKQKEECIATLQNEVSVLRKESEQSNHAIKRLQTEKKYLSKALEQEENKYSIAVRDKNKILQNYQQQQQIYDTCNGERERLLKDHERQAAQYKVCNREKEKLLEDKQRQEEEYEVCKREKEKLLEDNQRQEEEYEVCKREKEKLLEDNQRQEEEYEVCRREKEKLLEDKQRQEEEYEVCRREKEKLLEDNQRQEEEYEVCKREKEKLLEDNQRQEEEYEVCRREKEKLLEDNQRQEEEYEVCKREKEKLLEDKQRQEEEYEVCRREKEKLLEDKQRQEEEYEVCRREKEKLLEDKQRQEEEYEVCRREKEKLLEDKQRQEEEYEVCRREKKELITEKTQLEEMTRQHERSWRISHKDVSMTKEELGRGGWGCVMVGVFREQRVAVKQLHNIIMNENTLAIMNREINTMSRLRHPNLLLFMGAALDHPSGNPLIITEIMDTSLRKAYEKRQLPEESTRLSVLRDAAAGLNYLHCHPDEIIHRDISTANVLLESRGPNKWRAKLSDFGSANIASKAFTQAPGAAVYSAPELFVSPLSKKPQRPQTTKMDVYSYGIMVCEVMTCQFPESPEKIRTMLTSISTSCPPLSQMIVDCLDEEPNNRPIMRNIIILIDAQLKKY